MQSLSEKKIVICILAKNCKKNLEKNIAEIEKLASDFKSCSIIIVENASTDGTKELIDNWCKDSSLSIKSIAPKVGLEKLDRIPRMVALRNTYIEYCRDNISECDYALVIDGDLFSINVEQVLYQFEHAPENWAGLFANGQYYFKFFHKTFCLRYYDIFAYVPYGMTDLFFSNETLFINYYKILSPALRKNNYVSCESGFGGIGIYKYNAFINSSYSTNSNPFSKINPYICEHVLFNQNVAKYGKLYICKSLKPLYEKVTSLMNLSYMLYRYIRKR